MLKLIALIICTPLLFSCVANIQPNKYIDPEQSGEIKVYWRESGFKNATAIITVDKHDKLIITPNSSMAIKLNEGFHTINVRLDNYFDCMFGHDVNIKLKKNEINYIEVISGPSLWGIAGLLVCTTYLKKVESAQAKRVIAALKSAQNKQTDQ